MKKEFLKEQKMKLVRMKQDILNGPSFQHRDDLKVSPEDLSDEADLAQQMIEQNVTLNLREKELQNLRQIEMALQRIENNSYGHCVDCEGEIGTVRLQKRPFTDLCIEHAEERERERRHYSKSS